MSKIALSGNASGTGVLTIAAPNTNSDRTLTLPDSSGTLQVSGAAISGTTGTFTGLVDISAASAGQIKFPASQNASSDANTLDDYEEGTWTPTVFLGGTNNSIANATGTYTKIGNVVFFACRAESITKSGTGNLTIANLPFASSSAGNQNRYTQHAVRWAGINPGGIVLGLTDPGTSSLSFQGFTTTGGYLGGITDTYISASYNLYGVSGFYYTST